MFIQTAKPLEQKVSSFIRFDETVVIVVIERRSIVVVVDASHVLPILAIMFKKKMSNTSEGIVDKAVVLFDVFKISRSLSVACGVG